VPWTNSRLSYASVGVVFDTTVVDLTAELHDPVDILFATQLGGGTDINQAVARPSPTARASSPGRPTPSSFCSAISPRAGCATS